MQHMPPLRTETLFRDYCRLWQAARADSVRHPAHAIAWKRLLFERWRELTRTATRDELDACQASFEAAMACLYGESVVAVVTAQQQLQALAAALRQEIRRMPAATRQALQREAAIVIAEVVAPPSDVRLN